MIPRTVRNRENWVVGGAREREMKRKHEYFLHSSVHCKDAER